MLCKAAGAACVPVTMCRTAVSYSCVDGRVVRTMSSANRKAWNSHHVTAPSPSTSISRTSFTKERGGARESGQPASEQSPVAAQALATPWWGSSAGAELGGPTPYNPAGVYVGS